jgi:hypothetical protein
VRTDFIRDKISARPEFVIIKRQPSFAMGKNKQGNKKKRPGQLETPLSASKNISNEVSPNKETNANQEESKSPLKLDKAQADSVINEADSHKIENKN